MCPWFDPVCPSGLLVGRLVGWLDSWSVYYNFPKWRGVAQVTLPFSYRSTCFFVGVSCGDHDAATSSARPKSWHGKPPRLVYRLVGKQFSRLVGQ